MSRITAALTAGAFPESAWTDPSSVERWVAQRIVRVGALVAAAVAFGAFYGLVGPSAFVVPNLLSAGIFLLVGLLPRLSATSRIYLVVFVAIALFGVQLLQVGSIDNGIAVWLLAPPVGALLVGARRPAAITAVAAIVELAGVVVATRAGWLTPTAVLVHPDLVMLVCTLSVLALCGTFAAIARAGREELRAGLMASHEHIVAALASATAAQREALEAAEAKERFFANLTHEIRTPLNGIASTAELLAHTSVDAEQRELVDALGASAANLVALVNAMLDHARLRAGHMVVEPAPVDPRRAATNLQHLFQAQADGKGLELRVVVDEAMPAWIEVDAVKVRQVVGNLVGNALKITARGAVVVNVDALPAGSTEPVRLRIRVADTGPGIAPDQLEAVFEPFVQGDVSISRTFGGTGLGLAIGRQLAVLLGGSLTVESRPGLGSTFTLEVPIRVVEAPAAPDPAPGAGSSAAAPQGCAVLLAEDNDVNRVVAARMLELLGAQVDTAADGARAVELATTRRYDLVLMDLQMPDIDGIEATRIIRTYERANDLASVPIIALTGNDQADYGDACSAAGMSGYLLKPIGLAQLRSVVAGVGATD